MMVTDGLIVKVLENDTLIFGVEIDKKRSGLTISRSKFKEDIRKRETNQPDSFFFRFSYVHEYLFLLFLFLRKKELHTRYGIQFSAILLRLQYHAELIQLYSHVGLRPVSMNKYFSQNFSVNREKLIRRCNRTTEFTSLRSAEEDLRLLIGPRKTNQLKFELSRVRINQGGFNVFFGKRKT